MAQGNPAPEARTDTESKLIYAVCEPNPSYLGGQKLPGSNPKHQWNGCWTDVELDEVVGAAWRSPLVPKQSGRLCVYIGPMFSGKTSRMREAIKRAALGNISSAVIKYVDDARYAAKDVLATHDGAHLSAAESSDESAPIRVIATKNLLEVRLKDEEKAVGIDEGQFFPGLARMCEEWVREGRDVHVAILDNDCWRRAFEGDEASKLVRAADEVHKLLAVCMRCRKRPAGFTTSTTPLGGPIKIGAKKDGYIAVCRDCWTAPPTSL